ncbi:HEPN domain-containing protein [Novosphingobium sp. BL-52-GroH]|uniref:HEPN domain-containing protein n=1 Tax=Novosphingobium sp. BL-52-GroH TaxID=3349877 RepID=UPI0038502DA3
MILRNDTDHLPAQIQRELHQVTRMVFETFEEATKGRLSDHHRTGHILAVILHCNHAEREWAEVAPGEAFQILLIVNYPRLARSKHIWRDVRDRLEREWQCGDIARPVRLTVESLQRINSALIQGVPHFIAIAEKGIAVYQTQSLRLEAPRQLPILDRAARGVAEYVRWHNRARDFLAGAAFYRRSNNAPMTALLLHQACEHLYQCVLWSLRLHGPRTHALEELREKAEAIAPRLQVAWPRDSEFQRRAFRRIRRAYVEARYGKSYMISPEELIWAFVRIEILAEQVTQVCADHQASLLAEQEGSAPPPSSVPATTAPSFSQSRHLRLLDGSTDIIPRQSDTPAKWRRRLLTFRRGSSYRFWAPGGQVLVAGIALCLFLTGIEGAAQLLLPSRHEPRDRSRPADMSAVLDFDIHADTVLGAVMEVAERAGYAVKANDDIWAVRWTGAYRAKATTFDALADILYGSGLCPVVSRDAITIRYCDKSRPPIVATVHYQMQPGETVRLDMPP